jgi:hypothetical protein
MILRSLCVWAGFGFGFGFEFGLSLMPVSHSQVVPPQSLTHLHPSFFENGILVLVLRDEPISAKTLANSRPVLRCARFVWFCNRELSSALR